MNTQRPPEIPLILASTSIYRKNLIEKLGISFSVQAPKFDENNFKNQKKSPQDLALSLAEGKSRSLATPYNCVIGGDQLIHFEGKIIGKPHNKEAALEQLNAMQGKTHQLITAIYVVFKGKGHSIVEVTNMKMLSLSLDQLSYYLDKDKPFDCAGSYKIEENGITLFEKIECEDFTSIQGIPLMKLNCLLQQLGYKILYV